MRNPFLCLLASLSFFLRCLLATLSFFCINVFHDSICINVFHDPRTNPRIRTKDQISRTSGVRHTHSLFWGATQYTILHYRGALTYTSRVVFVFCMIRTMHIHVKTPPSYNKAFNIVLKWAFFNFQRNIFNCNIFNKYKRKIFQQTFSTNIFNKYCQQIFSTNISNNFFFQKKRNSPKTAQ